ncbi:MAG: hypothetical protein ABFS32_00500 [Bacteroidota bacterium]
MYKDIITILFLSRKKANTNYTLISIDVVKDENRNWQLTYLYDHPNLNAKNRIVYTILKDGRLEVNAKFLPEAPDKLNYMPRYGITMVLDSDYQKLRYYGRGPFENYSDRNTAAHVGLYESEVSDMYVPYIRPQENG